MTGRRLYELLGGELWTELVLVPNLTRPRAVAMRCAHVKALFEGAERLVGIRAMVHDASRKGELEAWHGQHELVFEGCCKALDALVEANAEREFEWCGTHWKRTD